MPCVSSLSDRIPPWSGFDALSVEPTSGHMITIAAAAVPRGMACLTCSGGAGSRQDGAPLMIIPAKHSNESYMKGNIFKHLIEH